MYEYLATEVSHAEVFCAEIIGPRDHLGQGHSAIFVSGSACGAAPATVCGSAVTALILPRGFFLLICMYICICISL